MDNIHTISIGHIYIYITGEPWIKAQTGPCVTTCDLKDTPPSWKPPWLIDSGAEQQVSIFKGAGCHRAEVEMAHKRRGFRKVYLCALLDSYWTGKNPQLKTR